MGYLILITGPGLNKNFTALISSKNKNGSFSSVVGKKSIDDLPKGDLLVKVEYSSLNYKDALSATGSPGVTKIYPHTPGIDAAGIVEETQDSHYPIGSRVIITGFDLGMNTSGGFGQYIRVPSNWAIKCPDGLSNKEAMMLGTAGLTAGLCIHEIDQYLNLNNASVVVSGATGGVGSMAVNILSSLGAVVTAITGKDDKSFLRNIGATTVLHRNEFLSLTRHPLNRGIYGAAIDVAGGNILSCILASMSYEGVVTTCGNVAGASFETTVFPFILRGNRLIGIDSAEKKIDIREAVWQKLASDWAVQDLPSMCKEVGLNELSVEIEKILSGNQTGRILVNLS